MVMRERTEPTHIMRIEIPLDLRERSPDFDAVSEAVKVSLAVSRGALSGEICNDIQVSVEER